MEGMTERPRARPDLTVVELDGEAVIYDEISGDLHRLNPTASIVFSFLDGSATPEELAGDLAGAYDRPVAEITAQVRELVDQLAASHLLVGTEPSPVETDDADDR